MRRPSIYVVIALLTFAIGTLIGIISLEECNRPVPFGAMCCQAPINSADNGEFDSPAQITSDREEAGLIPSAAIYCAPIGENLKGFENEERFCVSAEDLQEGSTNPLAFFKALNRGFIATDAGVFKINNFHILCSVDVMLVTESHSGILYGLIGHLPKPKNTKKPGVTFKGNIIKSQNGVRVAEADISFTLLTDEEGVSTRNQ